jgi:Golgi nucleoside diphosphatase
MLIKANMFVLIVVIPRNFAALDKSNYFSILYYNSKVWHLESLKRNIYNKLLSALANAICVALNYPDQFISFTDLHKQVKRATPKVLNLYELFLLLYKTFNEAILETKWIGLNIKQVNML